MSRLILSRRIRSLRSVDTLALGYLGVTAVLLVPGCTVSWVYPICIGLHVLGGIAILALAGVRAPSSSVRALQALYPMGLLLVLYGEVDLLAQLLHEPPGFDALVRQWDRWLFGAHLHHYLYRSLSGPMWREFFHLLYLAYYGLVAGAFVGVWRHWPSSMARFSFIITGMFVSFIAIFVAFPVAGPLTTPGVSLTTEGFFPSIVAWIYAPLTINGIYTGAFPSSHVGMSVGIVLGLAPRRWWVRLGLWALVLGIATATVYGRFHYAIDAVAGLAAGGLLYVLWSRFYRALEQGRMPAAPETDVSRKVASQSPAVAPEDRST